MNIIDLKKNIIHFLNFIKYEKNYSNNTINAYKCDLNEMIAYFELNKKDLSLNNRTSIQNFLSHISEKKISAKTLSRKIASIKSFFKYLINQEVITNNITKGISFPKLPKKVPVFLTENEIKKLIEMPKYHSKYPQRDSLILELLYSTGMRISELVSIKIEDIRLEEGIIKVLGKGKIERDVIIGSFAKISLKKYLKCRKHVMSIFLFPTENKRSIKKHISIRKVFGDVKKYLFLATDNNSLSPHSIRHTTATHMLVNGADLISIKKILGHKSLKSTQTYTHVQKDYIKKVYKQSHPEGS